MCDRFLEDIVSVTQACMHADSVSLAAFAHPESTLTANDLTRHYQGEHETSSEKFLNTLTAKKDSHAKAMEGQKETGIFRKPC
jgi:hypothetical protein